MADSVPNPLLPHAVPASADMRLVLYGLRRMAAGGIGDAHAAHAFLVAFGLHYRRPLVLLRALVAEIARTGAARLAIGPCCCPRMSSSEKAILAAVAQAGMPSGEAGTLFTRLLHVPDCAGVVGAAAALAGCFNELGRPLAACEDTCI